MDHREKLKWARDHFQTLQTEFDAFRNDDPYEVVYKYHLEKGGYIARLKEVKDIPPHWSLIIGDVVHSARSALDTLTYALARKNLRRPPKEREIKRLQFVIVDDLADWSKEAWSRLRPLDHDSRAEIFWIQPCNRENLTERHKLSVLRDLSNIDKHRHILIALASATSSSIELFSPYLDPGTRVEGYRGPLVKDTEIGRWDMRIGSIVVPHELHGDMKARAELGLDIQFAESQATPRGGSVFGFLPALLDYIETELFPPLENILTR